MLKKITIFIDESGTLPDPKDDVVVVAAVGTELPQKLAKISRLVRKYLTPKKKNISEIKFYRAGEHTKKSFLKELAKQKIDIFTLTVNKYGQRIPDSPENFALISWLLLEDCFDYLGEDKLKLVFDRHFHKKNDQNEFDKILIRLLSKKISISHIESLKEPSVNAADMVAGSLLWARTGKDKSFYELIKEKIISEKVIDWKQARRKFIERKNLAEPA